MYKPYSKMTERERLVASVVDRIKAGRANDPHATIEEYVANHSSAQSYYYGISQNALERLIRQVEKAVECLP